LQQASSSTHEKYSNNNNLHNKGKKTKGSMVTQQLTQHKIQIPHHTRKKTFPGIPGESCNEKPS
jgi:hypothetical protein